MIKTTIIIPCFNEEKYISSCIESILNSTLNMQESEILFVDGGSSDKTIEIIECYASKECAIKLLHNPKKYTPIGMNMGIKEARGEYIFIISAHAKYDNNYFSILLESIEQLDASCVGAVLVTDVKNKNKKSNSIKEVLSSPFGVGNSAFRVGVDEVTEVDTVAFGCYKKEVFEKYGYYDERLIRNQDIELNKRIIKGGGNIYLVPEVACTYYARENFGDLAKNQYQNGFWNILTAYYTKTLSSLSLRHFIPLLFVLSFVVPLSIFFVFPQILWVSFFSLVSYLSLVIILSFKLKNSSNSVLYLIMSFLTLHFSYGVGSLAGLFTVIKKYIKGEK